MRVAIITDQHFGCRKNSKIFHDYFLEFYDNVFFPYLEKEGIKNNDENRVDYPNIAQNLCGILKQQPDEMGILIYKTFF